MKLPPHAPKVVGRVVNQFWTAIIFIAFLPALIVLLVKVLERVWPFLLMGSLAIVLLRMAAAVISRHRQDW